LSKNEADGTQEDSYGGIWTGSENIYVVSTQVMLLERLKTQIMARIARNKHSSLLRTFISWGRKKFLTTCPGVCFINLFFSVIDGPDK
jgi:hypothetical protein